MYETELSALLTKSARDETLVRTLKASNDPSCEIATRAPAARLLGSMESGSAISNCPSSGAGPVGPRVPSQIAVTAAATAAVHAAISRAPTRDGFTVTVAPDTTVDAPTPLGMLTDFFPVSAAAKSAAEAKR